MQNFSRRDKDSTHFSARVCEQARDENQLYQDIVFLPHNDSYTSIGLKTLAMCKYAANISVSYLMKCDDDSFVRIPLVLAELDKRTGNIYMGSISYKCVCMNLKQKFISPNSELAASVRIANSTPSGA